MPICNECHYCDFQPSPGEFFEVTEEAIYADAAEGDWHPSDVEDALQSVGNLICPECGSTDVLTD